MSEANKKKVKLKLPEGISLPEGIEPLEIAVGEVILRKTMIGDDGKTYEVEEKIELQTIK